MKDHALKVGRQVPADAGEVLRDRANANHRNLAERRDRTTLEGSNELGHRAGGRNRTAAVRELPVEH